MFRNDVVEQSEEIQQTTTPVPSEETIGDFCIDAISMLLEDRIPQKRYMVLHEGSVYYLDLIFTAIKPPYNRIGSGLVGEENIDPKARTWMGQREN